LQRNSNPTCSERTLLLHIVLTPRKYARLHKILAEARAAQKFPWEPTRVSLYRTIFPQMTLWLPEDESAQLRFEFEIEIKRLEAA